jgi:hypothetical protein
LQVQGAALAQTELLIDAAASALMLILGSKSLFFCMLSARIAERHCELWTPPQAPHNNFKSEHY